MTRDFRQVLVELELLSHGSVQAWNKTAPASERNPRPHGETLPPHEEFAIDWWCAGSELERARVLREALEFLDRWRKGRKVTVVEELPHQRKARILKEGRDFSPSEVARAFKTHEGEIIAARVQAGLDPSCGREWPAAEDLLAQARRLRASGLSVRQIALYQQSSKSAVGRRLAA